MAYEREVEVLVGAVREAGAAIKRHYEEGARVYTKADSSPVTDADLAANAILIERLATAFPDDAILSEETQPDAAINAAARCWMIDPLDGTAHFVEREPTFAVMVGLEIGGRPVVGAIYHPMTDEQYCAVRGTGATVTRGGKTLPLRFSPVPFATARLGTTPGSFHTLTTGTPRWTGDATRFTLTGRGFGFRPKVLEVMFDGYIGNIADSLTSGGYPWDYCATDLIVHEAGGLMTTIFGATYRYRRAHERLSGGIVAACDPALHGEMRAALATE
ncbi:MAG: inositol monophosphatase family protein [Thermomicrobiales bacterium]